jgi:hypothetical protein
MTMSKRCVVQGRQVHGGVSIGEGTRAAGPVQSTLIIHRTSLQRAQSALKRLSKSFILLAFSIYLFTPYRFV